MVPRIQFKIVIQLNVKLRRLTTVITTIRLTPGKHPLIFLTKQSSIINVSLDTRWEPTETGTTGSMIIILSVTPMVVQLFAVGEAGFQETFIVDLKIVEIIIYRIMLKKSLSQKVVKVTIMDRRIISGTQV